MEQLLIFGDSVMKGVMHENGRYRLCHDHDFSSLTARGLLARNAAKMGATIENGLELLHRKLPPCARGTTVLLSFGGNDCDYDWQRISEDPTGSHQPAISAERFVALYRQAIDLVRQAGARVALTTILPLEANRYMDTICQGRDGSRILQWLGDVSHLYRWQEYYNLLICRLARSVGCPLVDLRAEFLLRDDFPSLICDDGIHPSQKGHDLIHQTIGQALAYCG